MRKHHVALLLACALLGLGAADAALTGTPTTQVFTYVTPPQTYLSTVTIPTVTETVTVPATTATTATTTTTTTTTTTPPSGLWAWDAQNAALSTTVNPASVISTAKAHTLLSASVAMVEAAGTPFSVQVGSSVLQVAIPVGTQPGHSSDHHLTVRDTVRGNETDMWIYDPVTKSARGGTQFPLGAVNELPGNADASRLPLRRGIITPADVQNNVLHPLVFSIPASLIASSPSSVYPASTQYGGTGPAGSPPFGAWFRLPPGLPVPVADKLSTYVFRCLSTYGMFLRDSGSSLTIYGLDAVNQGGISDWTAAGVTLVQSSTAGLWYQYLSSAIPWDKLQALQPPTP